MTAGRVREKNVAMRKDVATSAFAHRKKRKKRKRGEERVNLSACHVCGPRTYQSHTTPGMVTLERAPVNREDRAEGPEEHDENERDAEVGQVGDDPV